MIELSQLDAWREYARDQRRAGRRLGLVPTMGALHEGHAALFRAARAHSDVVLATSFVNPRQFSDPHDYESYPRTPEPDRALAQACGVDCLVSPSLSSMWPDFPDPTATTVSLGALGARFEGAGRPGHFDGVASVVAKIFTVTGPCRAYFGEKDFQQLAVVRQLVTDLGFDVEVEGTSIVRDAQGLALSSRNVRLSSDGRSRALGLSRALQRAGEVPERASALRATMHATMEQYGVEVAYAEVVDPASLVPCGDDESGEARALVAGFVEGVRLIDNAAVTIKGS